MSTDVLEGERRGWEGFLKEYKGSCTKPLTTLSHYIQSRTGVGKFCTSVVTDVENKKRGIQSFLYTLKNRTVLRNK